MKHEDTQTLTKMQEFSITTCSDRARQKFKRLEERIDKILIVSDYKIHALSAFSFLINPTLVDGFLIHHERREYWKGKENTMMWEDHKRNRLRKNNIIHPLWFIAHQNIIFLHTNRDLRQRADKIIKELLPLYDGMTIERKKAILVIVDGLIHEFINFHCEEAVAV